MTENIIIEPSRLNIARLLELQEKPQPFTPGEPRFWTDPHIARSMLAAHLDPNTDAASRRPETIDRIVDWIIQELGLQVGDAVVDLGCGPGLYTSRLAQRGLRVAGVDFSQSSIDYAAGFAREHGLDVRYRCQDYLTLADECQYDAALLIYGDFCPLSPEQRRTLLANVRRALKPGGRFVLDVSRANPAAAGDTANWFAIDGGFWRPGPYLMLEQTFSYPEQALVLDQYILVEDSGSMTVYRVWRQEYTPESIAAELRLGGFDIQGQWADLTGAPLSGAGEWIGIVARKN